MPYAIVKTTKGYGVKNTQSGKMHSTHSSKSNAQKQLTLLNAIEYGGLKPKKKTK